MSSEVEVFRKIPGFQNLKCSSDGRIFVESTGEEVEQVYSEHFGYFTITWNGCPYFVHRLIAMAWLGVSIELFEKLQVNHIDGNKLNNDKSNLEVVTASQNRIHAIEMGLAPAVRILRKDLRTGDVERYLSINECSRKVGISPATVLKFINNPNYVRKLFYVFIREGSEWPNLTKDDIGKDRRGMPVVVSMRNLTTNTHFIGKTISSAADLIGVRPDTLYAWMRNNKDNGKTYRGWEVSFVTDPVAIARVYASIPKKVPPPEARRKQFGYVVSNKKTGEQTEYESADAVSLKLGISRNYLRCVMSRNNGVWKDFEFRYN